MEAFTASEVHRKLIELFNAGRRDEAIQLVAPDAVDHRGGQIGDCRGREAWRQKWEQMDASLGLTIEENVSQGNVSVNRYRIRTVDRTSGKVFEVDGIDMVRAKDGQIVEHWGLVGR